MRLAGKTAFMAGAARNNGKAMALAFAREGADLILVAREQRDALEQVARDCEKAGVRTLPLLADLSRPEEVERAVQTALNTFGKVDVLVSSMGMRPHAHVWEYSYDLWHQVFKVNVHATFYLAKALAPAMIERKQGGSIIALGSGASLTGVRARGTLEAACKHSLYGLIKSLALDLGPHNIRANLIALGSIANERQNLEWYTNAGINTDADLREKIARLPIPRMGTREEVAKVALFLASDDSSYVTGDRIVCAGGRVHAMMVVEACHQLPPTV